MLCWLLRVARRADATARVAAVPRDVARRIWLRAECEVFELAERPEPDSARAGEAAGFSPICTGVGASV